MACPVSNRTPLPALVQPCLDAQGRPRQLLLAKATWRLTTGHLAAAGQQQPIALQPQLVRLGDLDLDEPQRLALAERAGEEIVWIDHDLAPPKPRFDLLLAGYVTAPPQHVESCITATLSIDGHTHALRACVPRRRQRGPRSEEVLLLAPQVQRVPVSHAVAAGPTSLLGMALQDSPGQARLLPWLLHAEADPRTDDGSGVPVGWGPWPPGAGHRSRLAGDFDPTWQRERMPALPDDFDPRFHNIAHPDLQLPAPPAPGTPIRLVHLAAKPVLDLRMPGLDLRAQAARAGGWETVPLQPDTLLIEPDEDRLSMVWRALLGPAAPGTDAVLGIRLFILPS